ncbi:toll/interleukin-1 receptor domain-containing protein [Streptomyces sp. NPDC001588]
MKIFLSHVASGDDRAVAEKLRRELERRGHTVWDPSTEISVGDSILDKLQQAIRDADAVVIVLSKESVNSAWQITETSIMLARRRESQRLIPLLVGDDVSFPPLLASYQGIRISGPDDDCVKHAADVIASALREPTQTATPSSAGSTSPDTAVEWAHELIALEKERSTLSAIARESRIRVIFALALIISSVIALVFALVTGNQAWLGAVSSLLAAATGAFAVLGLERRHASRGTKGQTRG